MGRREEVQTEAAAGRDVAKDVARVEVGGVGGQDRPGAILGDQLAKDLPLDGRRPRTPPRSPDRPRRRCRSLSTASNRASAARATLGIHLAALDRPVEDFGHPAVRALGGLGVAFDQRHASPAISAAEAMPAPIRPPPTTATGRCRADGTAIAAGRRRRARQRRRGAAPGSRRSGAAPDGACARAAGQSRTARLPIAAPRGFPAAIAGRGPLRRSSASSIRSSGKAARRPIPGTGARGGSAASAKAAGGRGDRGRSRPVPASRRPSRSGRGRRCRSPPPCPRRGRRCVPPAPGMSPTLTSGRPNPVPGAAIRQAQAMAISNPPPSTLPCISRDEGHLDSSIICTTSGRCGSTGGASNSVMSPPAMKVFPGAVQDRHARAPATSPAARARPARTALEVAFTGGIVDRDPGDIAGPGRP